MARNNIEVNLLFNAQTASAVSNIQQLGQLLNKISTNTTIGINSGSLEQAATAAQNLQIHLQNALNQDTGKLDLNKFNASLSKSGLSLQTLAQQIRAVGPEGNQAFINLANSIATAERSTISLSGKMKELTKTFANTVKWQISSSAVHAIMGSVQSAVNHAKDLDKALTNISIVTNKSRADMANFAKDAAKAADRLNTTATEYSKAALIFYQQGLDDTQAQARADIVTKLAKVTGDSAQEVSSQMTAIWNNFNDGSKSLEYYADVMAKLGAETAASTSDIAEGLSKFAPIAKTVGLSYETAASMIATVVDKTQQSADVVGTAFKTVFARIQGLKLGETLEDGLDLNKYSQALLSVGVNILDANGKLKEMDDILPQLNEKWENLSNAQKAALAQTVAGTRQYSQFMAVMENWDDIEMNVDIALDSEGTVQKQYNAWQNSFEGASTRLKNNLEELYRKFLNSDTLIKFTNVLGDVAKGFGKIIDKAGGLGKILTTVGLIFNRYIFGFVESGVRKIVDNIKIVTGVAELEAKKIQKAFDLEINDLVNSGQITKNQGEQLKITQKLMAYKERMIELEKNADTATRARLQNERLMFETMAQQAQKQYEQLDIMEKQVELDKKKVNKELLANYAHAEGTDRYFQQNEGKQKYIDITDPEEQRRLLNRADNTSEQRVISNVSRIETQLADYEKINPDKEKELFKNLNQARNAGNIEEEKMAAQAINEYLKEKEKIIAKIGEYDEERVRQLETDKERENEVLEIIKQRKKVAEEIAETGSVGQVSSFVTPEKEGEDRVGEGSKSGFGQANVVDALTNNGATGVSVQTLETGGTEVTMDASINNLEQTINLSAKYQATSQKLKATQTDLTKAAEKVGRAYGGVQKDINNLDKSSKNYKKDLKKLEKEQKQYDKTIKKTIKNIKDQGDSFKQLAEEIDPSKVKEIERALADLGDEEKAEQGLKDLATIMGQLSGSCDLTATDLDQMSNEIFELMVQSMSSEELDILRQKLEALAATSESARQKLEIVNGSFESEAPVSAAAKIQNISSGMLSVVGMTMSAVSAFGQLTTVIDENASASEKIMAFLSFLSGILPIVTTLTNAETMAKMKDTIQTTINTMAQSGNNVVKALGLALQGPYGWAILAGALAIGIATVAIIANTQKQEENNAAVEGSISAQQEALETKKEYIDAVKEELEVLDQIIDKYDDLSKTKIGADLVNQVDTIINKLEEWKEEVGYLDSEYEALLTSLKNAKMSGNLEQIRLVVKEAQIVLNEGDAETTAETERNDLNEKDGIDLWGNKKGYTLTLTGNDWAGGEPTRILQKHGFEQGVKEDTDGYYDNVISIGSMSGYIQDDNYLGGIDAYERRLEAEKEMGEKIAYYRNIVNSSTATQAEKDNAATRLANLEEAKTLLHTANQGEKGSYLSMVEVEAGRIAEEFANTSAPATYEEAKVIYDNIMARAENHEEVAKLVFEKMGMANVYTTIAGIEEKLKNPAVAGTVGDKLKNLSMDEATAFAYGDFGNQFSSTEKLTTDADIDYVVERGAYAAAAAEAGVTTEAFETLAKNIEKTNPALKGNTTLIAKVAKEQVILQKKTAALNEVYDDVKDVLVPAKAETIEYAEACETLADSLNDLLGTDLTAEDIAADPELYKQAAEGSEAAIEEILNNKQRQRLINIGIDLDSEQGKELENLINGVVDGVDVDKIEIGTTLDEKGLTDNYQALLDAGIMTHEQMAKLMAEDGWVPEFEMVEIKNYQSDDQTGMTTFTIPDPQDPTKTIEKTMPTSSFSTYEANRKFPVLKGSSSKLNNAKKISDSIKTTKKNDGGGSKTKVSKKRELVDRYKPVDDKLEQQKTVLEDIADLEDKLYGNNKLENYDRKIEALEKENKLLEEKLQLNKKYLQEDYDELTKFAESKGIELKFDTDGTLLNYEAIQSKLADQIIKDQKAGVEESKAQETLDEFNEIFENYKSTQQESLEILSQILENMYSKIEAINDKHLSRLEDMNKVKEKNERLYDRSYGEDKIKIGEVIRQNLLDENKYIDETMLPDLFEQRRQKVEEAKKKGVIFNDKFEALNEDDVIKYYDSLIEKAVGAEKTRLENEKTSVLGTIGAVDMLTGEIESAYDTKTENYEAYAEQRWKDFDEIIEFKATITELEIAKIDLTEAFIDDKAFSEKIALGLERQFVNNQEMDNAIAEYNDLMSMPDEVKNTKEWYDRAKEAAQAASEAIIENQQQLLETFETYKDTYSEIHELAMDAIEDYARATDTLEHYQNLVDALGKETDYEAIEKIQKASLNTTKENLKTLQNYLNNVLQPQRDQLAQEIANGMYTGDALEKAKEELEVLDDLVVETSNKINATLEEGVEKANLILEAGINKAIVSFEEAITGGFSLEELTQTIETLTKKQEEYLTKTNQLYETNKMIRQAQLEMDKTDNLIAKQKYQGFIKETQQLAEQERLSQQDLKIAEARYQLLQAQIALEEAQKAKDSMRLVRGADGNWDYVYTASQDKITDAEGKVADAENSLYNLGLEGAKSYRDKIISLDQEFAEKTKEINELYKNDEEKRQQKLDELLQNHLAIRKSYEEEYYKAYDLLVSESSSGYADYMLGNITSTQEFTEEAEKLYKNYNVLVEEWKVNNSEALNKVDTTQQEFNQTLADTYTYTANISDQINNTLIPDLADEAEAVRNAAAEWLNLYNNAKLANQERAKEISEGATSLQGASSNNAEQAKQHDLSQEDPFAGVDWSTEMLKALQGTGQYTYEQAKIQRQAKDPDGKKSGYTTDELHNILQHAKTYGNLSDLEGKSVKEWHDYVTAPTKMKDGKTYVKETPKPATTQKKGTGGTGAGGAGTGGGTKTGWSWKVDDDAEAGGDRSTPEEDLKKFGSYVETESTYTAGIDSIKGQKVYYTGGLASGYDHTQTGGYSGETGINLWHPSKLNPDMFNTPLGFETQLKYIKDGMAIQGSNANFYLIHDVRGVQGWIPKEEVSTKKPYYSFEDPTKYYAYDTGGYTGAWGPEGKFAMLHQKELVLNAQDTENMLATVDIVRQLSKDLDLRASSYQNALSKFKADTSLLTQRDTLKQDVTIHAEFPNVSSREEIEAAFNNLVNDAVQYVNMG